MVAWQVGALQPARHWVDEAMPMHRDVRRIARVVLLSAACGLSLAEGDLNGAVDLGRLADAEGTDLGVERELPLARSLLALALLKNGDLDEAAQRAAAAVEAAASLSYRFPLATALETVALVACERGEPSFDIAALMATAVRIRRAGDRPVPQPLATAVHDLGAALPQCAPIDDPTALVQLAQSLARG